MTSRPPGSKTPEAAVVVSDDPTVKPGGPAEAAEGALPAESDDPDASLVRAAQAGDYDAFEKLVRKHQHRVYNLAYRSLHDRQAAEDVAQEVFVSIFRYIKKFRGGARFTSWMFRIVVNHCRTRMRYRKRRPDQNNPVSMDASVETEDGSRTRQFADEDPTADPERTAAARQELDVVQQALNDLDEDHRMVLILRDIEDLNYAEIADILGLPEGTVKSRIHRARNQLKDRLSKYLDNKTGPR
jgi:RNA polymerase sigma-70 factor (ECF subfamily)